MSKVGKRYARALFESSSADGLELIPALLGNLAMAIDTSDELGKLLANPSIALGEREQCLLSISEAIAGRIAGRLSEQDKKSLLNFITVVFQAGRIGVIREISSEFSRLVVALKRHVSIDIETAQPLTAEQLVTMKSGLDEKYKNLATTTVKETPELLSGIRIKIGDTIVDSSIRGRLDTIRSKLLVS